MIGVQKRKSTCSPASANNNNNNNNNNTATDQQQQMTTTVKTTRKRTKLAPCRSHSASLANQNKSSSRAAGGRNLTKDHQTGGIDGSGRATTTDESVWIFGLINNIEQLLSTFTAINTNSTAASCNNSGTSTPTSLSSSFSFSSTSSSSSATSLASSRSNSASSSPASVAASPPSTMSSPSSCHPAAGAIGMLPRSPISRQIKFHEYKGPPSAKRQQPQQQLGGAAAAAQPQQPSSGAESQQQQIESKACGKSTAQVATSLNRLPVAGGTQNNNEPATRTALGAYSQMHPNQRPISNLKQGEQQIEEARQVLSFQHKVTYAHSVPVQQQQLKQRRRQQVASASSQNQLTSGAQCVNLQQTLYLNDQQNTLENASSPSANGTTALLAPYIETNEQTLVNVRPRQQQLLHQHPQLMQIQSASSPIEQAPLCASIAGCGSTGFGLRPVEETQTPQAQTVACNIDGRQESRLQYQSTSGVLVKLENPAMEAAAAATPLPGGQQTQQECANYLQSFNDNNDHQSQQHGFCSPREFMSDDLATFRPDSEDTTDPCEIEPSIGFCHGVEELLFSEFIDLQDVPMNVDESDWLKKFLPPCSMG